ncbi:hypothetical protein [Saccharopolyspora elongata]|uniref:hypothetical protein n=1 Tax=Saccharopolyspora elongata TaxID=2530387 RepID=UPI001404E4B8|nr:hypothetical protein [Saccharopolyspora elongata]
MRGDPEHLSATIAELPVIEVVRPQKVASTEELTRVVHADTNDAGLAEIAERRSH